MPLEIGMRLGVYHVLGLLGTGGMGEVYRATDTRLGRDVALKVLPESFVLDTDRLSRFEREAKLLASLNHSNIGAIYGIEESAGARALVLELVEGPTLADRVTSGPLSVADALAVARQVALALEAAHERGIIHRDLKPANIKLRPDGTVKVLDFGLAKATEPSPTGRPIDATITSPVTTGRGIVLGTPAYMSPEQARGEPVDERADIWAFGCVVFELLTGRAVFARGTISDTVAAIIEREPEWQLLPSSTPSRITWLLRRCLAKDASRRLHDIADARIEIDEALNHPTDDLTTSRRALEPRERLSWMAAIAGLLLLVILLFLNPVRTLEERQPAPPNVYNAAIVLPDGVRLSSVNPSGRFALSPDGRFLALSATDERGRTLLWVRPLEARVAQPLTGTDGAAFPFWSPDSRQIGFQADRKLKKIAASGGEVVTICDAPFGSGATWNKDGVILFTPRGDAPVFRVPDSGGTPVQVTTLEKAAGEVQHSYPFFLPDGRHFLYFALGTRQGGVTDPRGVFVGSLDSREPGRMLVAGASSPQYAERRLLFVRDGLLLAQSFDPDSLSLTGEPRSIAQVQVVGTTLNTTGMPGSFSVSQTGVLTYQAGLVVRSQLAWYDRSGTLIGKLGDVGDYEDVALSPEGSRVAVSLLDAPRGTRDLWIFDVRRGLRERFTFDPGDDFGPNWSRPAPDRLVFSSQRQGSINLYEKPANGVGSEKLLLADDLGKFNPRFSWDGQFLAYVAGGGAISRSDIWVWRVGGGGGRPAPFVDSNFVETHPQFSPDGRWLAYTSNESGQFEVYVASLADRGGKWRVSSAGGAWPLWNPDGKAIFYLALPGNDLVEVPLRADSSGLQPGPARTLFAMNVRPWARLDAYAYDVTADGQRFIVVSPVEDSSPASLTLVVNWTGALGQR